MYYTNGRIIIHKFNNPDELKKTVKKLEEFLLEDHGMKVEFKENHAYEFPAYDIPSQVSFKDLLDILQPNLALKAINEEIIVLPDKKTVSVKYYFTDIDKEKIASSISTHVVEKAKLEAQFASVKKDFNARLSQLEESINKESHKHVAGYEMRDYECLVKINFEENRKFYCDVNEPTTIRNVEALEPMDRQMKIFHTVDQQPHEEIELVNESVDNEETDGDDMGDFIP
jgi:hypothetical protein